ncbi:MAG: TfoX/Sxy family protein [Hyphomicrobiaceae bacterium]|nr:TfoX/Sxy family protein [Hyphomicrobiaceae bacterium]
MAKARSSSERQLSALPGLGPVSARMLVEVGVHDAETLRALGPVEAYRRLRFQFGRQATLNFMYALDCAVRHLHWRDLEPGRKDELRRAVQDIAASLAAPQSRRPARTDNKG